MDLVDAHWAPLLDRGDSGQGDLERSLGVGATDRDWGDVANGITECRELPDVRVVHEVGVSADGSSGDAVGCPVLHSLWRWTTDRDHAGGPEHFAAHVVAI